MDVTLPGMLTAVRPEHQENAPSPMEVTLSGMLTAVRLEHLETPRRRWR